VLVYSTHKHNEYNTIPAVGFARRKKVWLRPYTFEFIAYLFKHYNVAIWTSNIRENADAIINMIFTHSQRQSLQFVWTRKQCDIVNNKTYDSYKPLQHVWNVWPYLYDAKNTLIIDDSPTKIIGPPHCHYAIKSFTPDMQNDTELLKLISDVDI
jgi:hypothetical protein